MPYKFLGRLLDSQSMLFTSIVCSVLSSFTAPIQAQQTSEPAITAPLPATDQTPAIQAPQHGLEPITEGIPPQLSPDFQQALLAYTNGLAAFDRGDYAKAVEAFSYAITKKPDDPQFHYMAAKAYEGLGKFRGEWFHLRQAVRLQANHQEAMPLFLRMWQTALNKNILNIGTPLSTVKAALGKPDAQHTQNSTLWQYGFMGVEFVDDKVVGVMDLRGVGPLATPQEELKLVPADNREWILKQRSASRSEYQLIYTPKESTDSTEIITHQRLVGLTAQMTAPELMEKMQSGIRLEFPEVYWQVLQSTPNDVMFEWWLDDENLPTQYELVRLIAGQDDIHRLAYTSNRPLTEDDAARAQWITQLQSAELVPLKN